MELELKKAELTAYETDGEVILTQEETAETIVPDYCPDIARIIESSGVIYLHSRELREGMSELAGMVRVTVLYTPDGEGGIRALDFSIPFRAETDSRLLQGCQYMLADTEVELLESRTLNPRKIFTRCKLISHVTGYRKEERNYSVDLDTKPELCIEKRNEQQRMICLSQITEKDFTFIDSMSLSTGREGVSEILKRQISCAVTETKIVGNKLIFKGMLSVSVLYRSTGGQYCSTSGDLPFSQIMEVNGATEHAHVSIELQVTGCDLQIDGEDPEGRQLAVTLYFHAAALLRETEDLTLLNDLYSTTYEMRYDALPLTMTEFYEELNRRQIVREILEIGVVADTLLSASVCCGSVSVSRDGENTTLRTNVTVKALYLDEGGSPLKAERTVDISCSLELPENCRIRARAACTEEVQGSLGDRGIEVRFPIDFRVEAEKDIKKICISGVSLNTEHIRDTAGAPSLVLRYIGRQETAWDLAKKYNSTISAILAANQLEEEPLPNDCLLLIPRKRS